MLFNHKSEAIFKNSDKKSEPFSSQSGTKMRDTCVLCGAETIYDVSTPITERSFYILGCGQLCQNCYKKIDFLG